MINIIIPAYNCAKTLGRTLSSLVAQTDQNFEVIIVDDCSTEDITPIVEEYAARLNIKYIHHEENAGCGMSRQTGIDNVTTSHFMFVDSDDILMPYTIETFNAFLRANPKVELVHSYFYEQGMNAEEIPVYILHQNGFNWCHGKVYSREAVKRFGVRNDPYIMWADDGYFNSICCELFSMGVVPLPTYIWTNTQTSAMRKKDPLREKKYYNDLLRAMLKSCEFVSQYKERIKHVPATVDLISPHIMPDTEEAEMLEKLKSYLHD